MAVTGSNLYTEIMLLLMDGPTDGSADPTSGLYTRSEIMAKLNYSATEFNKRAAIYTKNAQTVAATSGTREVSVPTDVTDLLEVSYNSPTNNFSTIPNGSLLEADYFIDSDAGSADTPSIYALDDAPVQTISLIPTPNANNNVRYAYVAKPTSLPSPPDSTTITIPDDLTPFVKYGALVDIFGKSGETYDPFRQSICQQLFELGVDAARAWVSGQS